MELKVLVTTFVTIFLAELGDKTQLATLGFAAESKSRLAVFVGSAGALVLASLIAVLVGGEVGRLVPSHYTKISAGIVFVLLGAWMIFSVGGK